MTVTIATCLPANRVSTLCRKARERREARIIRALGSAYPKHISAKQLMIRSGFSFHTDPVRSFTLFCISFSKLNQDLLGTGWQAVRTGGNPDDNYWLSQVGAG